MAAKWKFDMFGTKLLYGEHSTKNVAWNVQHSARFISCRILRMRGPWRARKLDLLEVTATERIQIVVWASVRRCGGRASYIAFFRGLKPACRKQVRLPPLKRGEPTRKRYEQPDTVSFHT
jgi:hypothetical protein